MNVPSEVAARLVERSAPEPAAREVPDLPCAGREPKPISVIKEQPPREFRGVDSVLLPQRVDRKRILRPQPRVLTADQVAPIGQFLNIVEVGRRNHRRSSVPKAEAILELSLEARRLQVSEEPLCPDSILCHRQANA